MTFLAPSGVGAGRTVRPRRFAMCRPRYFEVSYTINPWMQLSRPVDRALALRQWEELRATYVRLGHRVDDIAPEPGLPDLVFAANAGLVIGGRALASRFRHDERRAEEAVFVDWFRARGLLTRQATLCNEGEGDYLVTSRGILAGSGFRSDTDAHREVAAFFGRPVIPLTLVDPRFYHLDTALAVLDDETIAYWPGAFSPASRAVLRRRFPDAVEASEDDAVAFGLNACSDGRHVVMAAGATGLARRLAGRGFEPVLVETSELQKAGGSAKCCTLELRA
jgi:N-dimethylarginine dimethylaminohydrolase